MKLFAHILTGAALALTSCNQWPQQPPPRPMFGPGSASQPYGAVTAPAYPSQPQPPAPPPANWSNGATTPPASSWQRPGAARSQSLGHGATLYDVSAGGTDIQVVVFDSRQCVLRVIDQPSPNAGGGVISQAMPYHRAIAGVNGGFFHPDFQPLGLLLASGRKHGQFTHNKLLSGSVLVVSNEPYLVWNSEFLGEQGVSDLIQSGPRLVDRGRPIDSLDRAKLAPRTFIANDGKRIWAIGVARNASLAGLAELLARPGFVAGLQIERALNLDGGRSSAFWARTAAGREISQPGWSTVRNYLAVVPR
ncbi:MAG: phosphodiester glycosidase family protein [Prosthecobacter sp.]|nr:phosphodiester glycosidase family protein [Prosthecobacter sp.]